jgi:hypothetical protein
VLEAASEHSGVRTHVSRRVTACPLSSSRCAGVLWKVWLCSVDTTVPGALQPVDTSANYTGNVTTPSGASVERLLYGVSQKLLGVAFINGQVRKHCLT